MALLKVIEILAESPKSWEDAASQAVAGVSKTIRYIRSVHVENLNAKVEDGNIVMWRLNCKITFEKE